MECFMIKTGFYDKCVPQSASSSHDASLTAATQGERQWGLSKARRCHALWGCTGYVKPDLVPSRVTQIEAERLDESREEREAFKRMLREEVERQAQEKHIEIHLPDDKA